MTLLKKVYRSFWFFPLLFFIAYGILFLAIKDRFLFTPDFSSTDVFHFNIAYKYHLWKSIRSGVLPFWTDMLDGGYPILAESQMGTFFLPYYIIFPFFSSFSHAYAFLFSFHLFLFSFGMYLLLRTLKRPPFLSFLLSLIFTWNGSITFRWVHFTVLQAFSFVPLLYWIYLKWNKSKKIKYLVLLSLLLSQMIFAGFIQIVFISLLGLVILYMVQNYPLQRNTTGAFFCAIMFGVFLSLPQIIPTLQLSRLTSRSVSSSYDFAVSIPFNVQNMCAFVLPDCLGSPKNATYSFNIQRDGVYWENTPYIGLPFVCLLLIASAFYFLRKKINPLSYIFLALSFLFLMLGLGKNSPLYFIFSIFPFSMFRTPPRYLLLSVFFLILYASLILNTFISKRTYFSLFIYCALVVNCILLVIVPFNYHLFIDSSKVYESLQEKKFVNPNGLYMTYGSLVAWNSVFLKEGWNTKKSSEKYLFMNRALISNSNLVSGQKSFEIYASLDMRRQQYLKTIITEGLDIASASTIESSQSARIENILQLYNITSLVSFKPLYLTDFLLTQVEKKDDLSIYRYQNKNDKESLGYYIPNSVKNVTSLEDLESKIYTGALTQSESLAESLKKSVIQNGKAKVIIKKSNDTSLKSIISADDDTYIVFRKNWYPEWKLLIDGKESQIYKTNLIHIGFIVPQGTHLVELQYVPSSFYLGCFMTAFTLVSFFLFLYFKKHQGR